MVDKPKLSRGKREIKKFKKDIGPGIKFKLNEALSKFSDSQTKAGVGFMAMTEYITRGMPRGAAQVLVNKYQKMADKILKTRKQDMAKYKFKATEKKKEKYYGSKKGGKVK